MSLISDIFGGASDFAAAAGYSAESVAYGQAEKYAKQNAVIAGESGKIKLAQTNRQIFQTIGAQQAEVAGAGFTSGGSSGDIYRNSIQQGALDRALVQEQTQINVTGYEEQASQFQGLSSAAAASAASSAIAGVGSIVSALVP